MKSGQNHPLGKEKTQKVYRLGYTGTMFREYVVARYLSSRLTVVSEVLGFRPRRKEPYFSYVFGQRVLEWVMQRFGDNADLARFQSFHGLNPPHYVDPEVAVAFARFCKSTSNESLQLRETIRVSYSCLHRVEDSPWKCDHRNAIYNQDRVFIDFDHVRPSLNPAKLDSWSFEYWYNLPPVQESSEAAVVGW